MPSLASRVVERPANYQSVEIQNRPPNFGSIVGSEAPTINKYLRCSLPPIVAAPDNIRQFYVGGIIPQTRVYPVSS